MSRSRGNWPAYLAALVAGFLLVACAEEDTGPQFATDPRPTRSPTEAVASPSPALLPTAESIATPASFTDLLGVRGAVSTVYVVSGNDVWSISSDGEATRLFAAPDGSTIRAIDPSPDAQEVAILLETGSSGRRCSQVVMVDAAGSVVARVELPVAAPATPVTRDCRRQANHRLVSARGPGSRAVRNRGCRRDCRTTRSGAPVPLDFGGAAGSVSRTGLVSNWAKYRVHLRKR